jgi:hypothetical protein
MTKIIPPRLFVISRPESKVAVIIRRGPTKRARVFRWDLDLNEIIEGHKFFGRIYEKRCDLSIDGKYWIYFVLNGQWDAEHGGSWTAISEIPTLEGLTVLGKGDGWHGGGHFIGNRIIWLNDGYGHKSIKKSKIFQIDDKFSYSLDFGGECPHPYFNKMIRDGWILNGNENHKTLFTKVIGPVKIKKYFMAGLDHPVGKGVYLEKHSIFYSNNIIINNAE